MVLRSSMISLVCAPCAMSVNKAPVPERMNSDDELTRSCSIYIAALRGLLSTVRGCQSRAGN